VEPAKEHDPGLGSLLLGLFGFESSPSELTSTEEKALVGENLNLCPTCKVEVTKWTETLAKHAEEDAEEELRSRVIYDALACFASGALMGIVFGILKD